MSNGPKVSVVMSVYNDAAFVGEAIKSILDQTFGDFEFVIVDDGSTDSSRAIIRSFADRRIRTIDNEENLGLPNSLNKGIRVARGKYVARQDADDVSLPERLGLQWSLLDRDPTVALMGCWWTHIDVDGDEFESGTITNEDRVIKEDLVEHNVKFPHGCLMFRKEVLDRVGGYDERFRYSQDLDLQLRLVKTGHGFGGVDRALYKLRKKMEPDNFKSECQARFRALAFERFSSRDEVEIPDVLGEVRVLGTYGRTSSRARRARYRHEVGQAALENRKFGVARKHMLRAFLTGDLRSSFRLTAKAALVSARYVFAREAS